MRTITDYNEFLPDGETPNPNFGQTTTEQEPSAPAPVPRTLSATAFNKYAASRLAGGGAAGMVRFMAIMEAGRAAGGVAAFAVNQYDKALTFDKAEVLEFGGVLKLAGCMTQAEVDAIAGDAWPSA